MRSRYVRSTECALWYFFCSRFIVSGPCGQVSGALCHSHASWFTDIVRVALAFVSFVDHVVCTRSGVAVDAPLPSLLRPQQRSLSDPKSVAFFSELTLTCGCQCSVIRPPTGATKVVPASPGKCEVVKDTSPHHQCDFMGGYWCDTISSARYVFTGTDKECKQQPSVIQQQLSTFQPSDSFGRS